jgi:pyruvate-formate lyase
MLNWPKLGNDDDAVDSIYTQMSTFVNEAANEAGRRHGLDYFLICNLNPGGLYYAPYTQASADGRKTGDPLAMGNNPTAGRDTQGLTALLNSMTKLEKRSHGGYVHNLKVGPDSLKGARRKNFDALLKTYFEHHGCQIMVTAIDPQELENAMQRPEDYGHLLVRVCGWTCRFTELNAKFQREIIDRTLYA